MGIPSALYPNEKNKFISMRRNVACDKVAWTHVENVDFTNTIPASWQYPYQHRQRYQRSPVRRSRHHQQTRRRCLNFLPLELLLETIFRSRIPGLYVIDFIIAVNMRKDVIDAPDLTRNRLADSFVIARHRSNSAFRFFNARNAPCASGLGLSANAMNRENAVFRRCPCVLLFAGSYFRRRPFAFENEIRVTDA